MRSRLFLFIFLLLTSCVGLSPFRAVELQNVESLDSVKVRENFAAKVPERAQIISSFEFKSRWKSFYSLGCLEYDIAKDEFVFAALSPAGMKLFQITDKKGKVNYSCPIEEMKKLAPYANYVANDIKNIYFDNVPSNNAFVKKEKDKIVFTEYCDSGKMEYIFGGRGCNLLRKVFLKKRSWFWRIFLSNYYELWAVGYYGYKYKNDKLYPENIVYENNKFGYQLVIRLKSD